MKEGFFQNPQDLKMFGLIMGFSSANEWKNLMMRYQLEKMREKEKRNIRNLHDVPPDLDPRKLKQSSERRRS